MAVSTDNPTERAKRKVTVRLPEDVYATTQEAVALGLAASQSLFIEEAIRQRAREVRHARLRKLAAEAMNDPGFVADMQETMGAFRELDAQTWPPGATHRPEDASDEGIE